MGQDTTEEILRSHLAKYGCEVELGTALSTFQQDSGHVTAVLTKSVDGKEHVETIEVDWLIGGDGAHGTFLFSRIRAHMRLIFLLQSPGVTRKALGLTFIGESRENMNLVTGDVHVKGISTDVRCNFSHI